MTPETARTLSRLRSLLAKGKTLAQAGRQIKRSKSTVHRLAVRHGIAARRRQPRLSPRTDEQIRRRLGRARYTLRRIAELSRVSLKAVWLRARKLADAAGEFRPRGIRAPRRCPRHGLVKVWPCVACAAERARGSPAGKETRAGGSPQSPG